MLDFLFYTEFSFFPIPAFILIVRTPDTLELLTAEGVITTESYSKCSAF